ncbi:MAG: signal recognition particle-docking protein FtsY [Armatimonadota bacterium]
MRLLKGIFSKVDQLLTGRRPVDDELFDELEELLIQADLSVHTATKLVDDLREASRKDRINESDDIKKLLKDEIIKILSNGNSSQLSTPAHKPIVYLIVGVNGVGKTTSIAKLANFFKKQNKKVILAASDTFRAAAVEQLEIWANRVGVDIVKHKTGADPAAVLFDAIEAGKARNADIVIADTAGRLHTKSNLMDELSKVGRVCNKALDRDPDETLLVLDGTTGQNAVVQAKQFHGSVPLSGIILTKLDGTAKGGIVVTIKDELGLPIKVVTTGEKLDDIEMFNAEAFVDALFES